MSDLSVREITPDDLEQVLRFITDLAVYEREPDAVHATVEDLHAAFFGESPKVFGMLCEHGGKPIGFAVYFFNFSTWLGTHGVYLEDLFVAPQARGMGAGKALLKAVGRVAWESGCGRYEWSVLRWNTPSIEFYEAVGAEALEDWVGYRMDRETLGRFVGADE